MAKEMMIMFVYDTQFAKAKDADDDATSAILYFHPNWVSDQQRTSLCGQIIGTAFCLKTVFNCPRILALQSGKFCICDYGRYILVIGTDRNVADWVLEYRTHMLSSFITFFHKDLGTMSQLYETTRQFTTKLYYMFDTYLKVLLYGGNMFSNIPSIQLPKSASNVFLEAIHVLRLCQKIDCVLGGTLLYHNKVVATQLGSNITKRLVLTDPYRIKSPAETVKYRFKLPIGVQLLRVFIDANDYQRLLEESDKIKTSHQYFNNKNKKSNQIKPNPSKEPILLTMKRDQSLIFTTVPEEDVDNFALASSVNNCIKTQNRPKFLNLRCKTTDAKVDTRPVPSTPFIGNTSICSTPMTDLNKVLHQNAMSICLNMQDTVPFIQELENGLRSSYSDDTDSVNSMLSAVSNATENSRQKEKNNLLSRLNEDIYQYNKCLSLCDVRVNRKALELDLESSININSSAKRCYRTITDPTFPVFRSNGMPVSESLHTYHICNGDMYHIKLQNQHKQIKKIEESKEVWLSIKDFDVAAVDLIENKSKEIKSSNKSETSNISVDDFKRDRNKEFRRSLSLPLKSLSNDTNGTQNFCGFSKLGGIQLTPLLSKLSVLALEEKSSGFCSRDVTPSEYKDVKFATKPAHSFINNNKRTDDDAKKFKMTNNVQLKTVVLFVCGQQDMVINLLIDEEACETQDIINDVWQMCVDCLGKLEKQIHHCLEIYPGGSCQNGNSEPYSYLCMNPHWDTIHKGGPWSGVELGSLTHLHRDFINENSLTEILLRDDDSIIYGHTCGKTEVFYHQTTTSNAGLPAPSDPMGIIPLKAKRRLERDHAIILH